MSLSSFNTFFPIGQEPYTKPVTTQPQNFQYPVTCNDTLQCNTSVTLDAGATCNNDFKMNSGTNVQLFNSTNEFRNLLYTDNYTGGVVINSANGQNLLPIPSAGAGMSISWDIDDGDGTTDLINYSQGGAGLGINLRAINTNIPACVTVATLLYNKLPTFTYGPVVYGLIDGGTNTLTYSRGVGVSVAHVNIGTYNISFLGLSAENHLNINPATICISTTVKNIGSANGPVIISEEGTPTINASGYITFQLAAINLSRETQDCNFYFTVFGGY